MSFALVSAPEGRDATSLHETLPVGLPNRFAEREGLRTVRLSRCSFEYWNGPDHPGVALWCESGAPEPSSDDSFVYVSGWSYRIGSAAEGLRSGDYNEILDRLRRGLPPMPEDASGSYIAVIHDARTGLVAIQPDRWAMRSLYHGGESETFAVSTYSTFVAQARSASFDGQSVLSLMRGTHMPLGRTLFSDVHRVMIGEHLVVDTKEPSLRVRASGPIYVSLREQPFEESLAELVQAVSSLGGRLTGSGRSMVDLTGGNDSRLTAAGIRSRRPGDLADRIVWRVAGAESDPDVQVARRITKRFGWNLVRLNVPELCDATAADLENVALQSDGTCLLDSAFGRIRQEGTYDGTWDWLVGSIGGELLRGFFWRQEILSLGRSSRVDFRALLLYRLYASEGIQPAMLGEGAPTLSAHDEILLDGYRRVADAGGATLNPYKLDILYLHKLCYNAGNAHSWLAGMRNIRLPLLTWEATQTVLAMPWRRRANRRLVLSAIRTMCPELSSIPNDKGESMDPTLRALPSQLRSTFTRVTRNAPRIALRYLGRRSKASKPVPSPPMTWIGILRESRHVDSMVGRATLDRISDRASSDVATRDDCNSVYGLLTMELLLRRLKRLRASVRF